MRKIGTATVSLLLAVALALAMGVPRAHAAKVDCSKVMQELNSGKKPKQVAADMKISASSVYRCRRRARKAAKAEKPGTKTEKTAPPATH